MKRWLIAIVLLLGLSVPAHAAVVCVEYVDSTAGGNDSGDDWANARPSMMIDWGPVMGAGEIVCVSKDHAETGTVAVTLLGSTAEGAVEPVVIVCVDDADSDSLCGAGERATVTTTGTGDDIAIREKVYIYGVFFFSDNSINLATASDSDVTLEESRLELTTNSSGDVISIGGTSAQAQKILLINVDIDFANAGSGLSVAQGEFLWDEGTLDLNTTNLIKAGPQRHANIIIRNVDLSLVSNNLILAAGISGSGTVRFDRCKFHATTTLVSGTIDVPGATVTSQHCQSGSVTDPPYQMEQKQYQGTIQVSTTNVRTGGASDGTTTYAWEFDADGSSYLELYEPLCSTFPIARWVSGGSSITAKIHLAGPAGLDDTEAFIIWSIPPVGATSLGIRESSRALPGSSAGLTSEAGETWTSGTKYSISTAAFTPAEDGVLLAWPCIAYDSGTDGNTWFDPKVIVE